MKKYKVTGIPQRSSREGVNEELDEQKHGGPHDPPLKHEGGNIPPHKHPHQSYRDRWNLEIKQNQDMDMTRHVVNERPLLNLDGTDPDAGYNQWINQNVDYGTNPNKSWLTHAYEGVVGIPELLTETIPNYIAETAEDAYDQFKKSSILPANIANAKKDTSRSIRERLYRTVTPIGYDWKHAAKEFIANEHLPFKWDGQDVTFETFDKMDRFKDGTYGQYIKDASMDAWGMYLGIPQKYDTYKTSQYKPSKSKNKNAKYYSFNWDDDIWDEALENKVHELETNKSKSITDSGSGGYTLQNYKLSKGYDKEKKLPYISYYDNNDYNIDLGAFDIKGEDIVGEAFEVYGRMYYDPKTMKRVFPESKPKKEEGGVIEVELTDEEADKYRAGGYVLEKLVDGGEDDVVRPKGDPYEYKKVGDKYYTRKREGEYDQEYPAGEGPGWDLAGGEAKDAIKYRVFKEQKPVVEDPIDYTYDINDPKNFESRYWNDIKLDQSQDGLKPQYFTASNLPLVGLDGTDPNAEYNAYVAAKPQHTRAPSWFDKNVIEPVSDLYDKFQKTSLGPIDDAANAVNEMFIQPIVTLATDTYNDPNKVAGEVMQMMVDGVQAPSKILAESIYTDFINPEAEFNWNNIGSEKSLQRAGEIATILPMVPNVFGTAAKTAAVTNKVDDVVNVANKTKKTIPRPTAAVTTQETALTKIQQLKKDGLISPTLNEQALIDNPSLLDAAVRDGIKKKLTVNRNVYTGDDFASQVFPDQAQEAFYTGTHTDLLGNSATGQRVGLKNMGRDNDALYTFRGKGDINTDYGTHNVESRIPFDYSGSTDEMVTNFNNLQNSRVVANPNQMVNVPANQIKPGAVIDDVSGEGITAVVGEKGSKVLDPVKVTTDVELTKLNTNYQTLNKEADAFMKTQDVSAVNKKYNTNFKNAEETQKFLNKKVYEASKKVTNYQLNVPKNRVLKTTNYSPFDEFSNTPSASTTTAMAETSSGNVVPVNNLQKVKNSPYMKGSDGKTYLRESEYNNFTGTRKANLDKKIANGEVEVLRQTPDGNAYLLSDESIANIDTTVKAKLDRMKTDKGRQLTFEQEKAYIKKEFPEMDEASINQAANQAVDARIAEVESLYKNKNYQTAYYDLEEMNAHFEIGDDVINSTQYQPEQVANFDKTVNPVNKNSNMRFHPGIADDAAVVSHEGAHITAPGRNLPIEDEILNAVGSPKNLSAQDQVAYDYLVETSKRRKKLINDMRNHDPANANLSEAELIDKYSNLGQSKGDIFTGDYTFANDIKKVQHLSSEVLPYAQELKQVLLDRGLIDDWFQEITPDILAKAKQTMSQEPAGFYTADMLGNVENATSTTRLLDITDPSRYQQLSNSLNKIAPVAVPAAAVGTGTMMNEQDGGFIEAELTPEEVERYRAGGYVLEKIK